MRSSSARSRVDDNQDDTKPPAIPRLGSSNDGQQKPSVIAAEIRSSQKSEEKQGRASSGGVASVSGGASDTNHWSRSSGVDKEEKKRVQVTKIERAVSLPGAVAVAGPSPPHAGTPHDTEDGKSEEAEPSSEQQQQNLESSDLLVAAEIAPTDEDIEARVAAQVEKRIINEAPRADVVVMKEMDAEEDTKPPRCNRWLLLLGLLAIAAAAVGIIVALVVNNDGDDEPKSVPPPTPLPPDSDTRYTMFQVDWYGIKNILCEDSNPGVVVSCGEGGTIELWGISDFATCTIVGGSDMSCTSAIAEDDDWHKVLCACRGSSPSAWATRVQAVPDTSVVCADGGVAGTRLTIGLMCPGEDLDYTHVQCDPTDAVDTPPEVGVKTCFTEQQCLQDTCDLSLPLVASAIPGSTFSESCLYGF